MLRVDESVSRPVVGYSEISFYDNSYQKSRAFHVWYPVESQVNSEPSPNLWDLFDVAVNSPISASEIKKSVIVISHGYRGMPHQLSWLINKLVQDNSIVLGIQHFDEIENLPQINHWKRAKDVRTLLDEFIAHPFSSSADLNRIGIAGFSVGGTTAIWVAGGRSTQLDPFVPGPDDVYPEEFTGIEKALPTLDKEKMAQDWKDERIKAVFLMTPAWGWIFDKEGLQNISIPTYIVAPNSDNVLKIQKNAKYFAENMPNCSYKTIPGNHYVFIAVPKEKERLPSFLEFLLIDDSDVDRKSIQSEVAEKASGFFLSAFSKV